jgi:hypothetical protein
LVDILLTIIEDACILQVTPLDDSITSPTLPLGSVFLILILTLVSAKI